MPHPNPLPAARSNGAHEPESKARSLTTGSALPFLTDTQRAALDAALAVKLTTLTTGALSMFSLLIVLTYITLTVRLSRQWQRLRKVEQLWGAIGARVRG